MIKILNFTRSFFLLLLLTIFSLLPGDLYAQTTNQFSSSYITPFPKAGKYTVYIAGASLANGLANGLSGAFAKDKNTEVKKFISYNTGLARLRRFQWKNELGKLSKKSDIDILVILFGLNEQGSIRIKKQKYPIGSDEWKKVMGDRVSAIIKNLKKTKVAVYWVGLPIMRSPKLNQSIQVLNEIFRKQAFINGVKFIDTWNGFADQFGRYSAFGPDINGKIRRLRDDNGVNLSARGNRKLAHFIEREIRRDMTLARAEREIPLAGTIEEQKRIAKDISNKPIIAKRYKDNKAVKSESFFAKLQRNLIGTSSKQKDSENPHEISLGDIKIIRPPVSDIVLSGSAASKSPGALNAISGEIVANNIGSGLTALATITSSNELSLKEIKQRVPIKQTSYYRVLVKGESLKPKPGRADDFTWSQ